MAEASKSPSPPPEVEPLLSQSNSGSQGQLNAAVDDLLNELQSKFENVSTELFGKLDDMTKRLDDLEASLAASNSTTASPSK
ncbi:hypothetical protein N7541_009857 [Penicillium brevicompactum]|uniref:Heat shock factor binding 1 n=1 Tax=Penicillium brevicompactum TaxID=5074 RepID=A0A9W9QTI0_PENBR|nr:uncharacterized protein N7506_010433 [Penicillium brevicompactum]KAJ5327331.1 hypothetical protein N7506_010433 [Penicillium brevicompactum]KAJ5340733.1 hypothetical protein N7541_009857 [Penicillium brevicompactum]